MATQPIDFDAPVEPTASEKEFRRKMKLSSLSLLRAMERARGLYPSTPARKLALPVRRVRQVPGEGLGRSAVRSVAAAYSITPEDLVGSDRSRHFVCARAVTARILRDLKWQDGTPRFSLPQIGVILGGRDHSTVINLLNVFPTYCRSYPFMRAVYDELSQGAGK